MTVAQRIAAIRLMEKMEKSHQSNNSVIKDEDGTLKYINKNVEVLVEAKQYRKA